MSNNVTVTDDVIASFVKTERQKMLSRKITKHAKLLHEAVLEEERKHGKFTVMPILNREIKKIDKGLSSSYIPASIMNKVETYCTKLEKTGVPILITLELSRRGSNIGKPYSISRDNL